MDSAFGIEHGFSKMYTETRIANADDLSSGEWVTRKYKKPGKLKSLLRPKAAAKQSAKANQPFYASRYDDQTAGDKTLLSHGEYGNAKKVKAFSNHVSQYDPKGPRSY